MIRGHARLANPVVYGEGERAQRIEAAGPRDVLIVWYNGCTRLTPLGAAILDAGRDVQARLGSEFDRLAADFAGSVNAARGLLRARRTGTE